MKIREEWLYYIWKLQYFNKKNLITCQGEKLTILSPGIRNEHAGPDFLNASITIGDITWHGHIELHITASSWQAHKHDSDPAYENVILHVVWDNDLPIQRQDNTLLPTLSLHERVDLRFLEKCEKLIQQQVNIPCARQLFNVTNIIKTSTLDRVLLQRLSNKNTLVYQLLNNNQGDWEETAYQLLAYSFGFKINKMAMLDLSLSLPLKIIKKHYTNLTELEALLLGQAGLLEADNKEDIDTYRATLIDSFTYLRHKYQLNPSKSTKLNWKFFRLRPANFPTIRITQLAQVLHQHAQNIFNWLTHTSSEVLKQELTTTQSIYWQQHYIWNKPTKTKIPGLGLHSIENILINTVVPLLVAYGKTHDQQNYVDQAIAVLQSLPPEENAIIQEWSDLGMKAENAFDSQAFIELFNNFCTKKKCLECNIGINILERSLVEK